MGYSTGSAPRLPPVARRGAAGLARQALLDSGPAPAWRLARGTGCGKAARQPEDHASNRLLPRRIDVGAHIGFHVRPTVRRGRGSAIESVFQNLHVGNALKHKTRLQSVIRTHDPHVRRKLPVS
jgi:hypothetical protein